MKLSNIALSALFAAMATPSFADILIHDAYARGVGMSGAAFMAIENTGPEADHLLDARSDIAARVELHTHVDAGDGVMQMRHVPEGWDIPVGEIHVLMRGGDHVMFMGLKGALQQGETVEVTLVFEQAGEVVIQIPVDNDRQEGPAAMQMDHGASMDHSGMGHN